MQDEGKDERREEAQNRANVGQRSQLGNLKFPSQLGAEQAGCADGENAIRGLSRFNFGIEDVLHSEAGRQMT